MVNRPDRDLYEILQVNEAAHVDVIQAAYRRLSLHYHPDRNASSDANEMMAELNRAYEILSDPVRRQDYDRSRTPSSERWSNEPNRDIDNRWRTWEEIDPLTQEKTAYAMLHTQEGINQFISIGLGDSPNSIFLMIYFNESLTLEDEISVQYRIGNRGVEEDFWQTSSDGKGVIVPLEEREWFIKEMLKAQELVVRVFPDYGGMETAIFKLGGLAQAWQELLRTFQIR